MSQLPQSFTGPGLIDLQCNGYLGLTFTGDPADCTPEKMHEIRSAMRRRGVLAALVTLTTDKPEPMIARARHYGELVAADAELAATFPKLHIEGPFISPVEGPVGAHRVHCCAVPAELPDLIDRINDASGGRVGIVTLAPELPGAVDLTARLAAGGICVAIGHTDASAEAIDAAVRAGAKMSTHLGNGSHQMLPRLDNYVQHQLADDRLHAGFIADGHHVPFATLKNFLRAKTFARSVLVTDAMMAAELGPGTYASGPGTVVVAPNGRAARPGQPNLAGSTLTLDRAVVNACLHCDVPFEQAWAMASTRPAALVDLDPPETVTVTVSAEGLSTA